MVYLLDFVVLVSFIRFLSLEMLAKVRFLSCFTIKNMLILSLLVEKCFLFSTSISECFLFRTKKSPEHIEIMNFIGKNDFCTFCNGNYFILELVFDPEP